jgi:TonB family protein
VNDAWLEGDRQAAISGKLAGDDMFSIAWEGPVRVKVSGALPEFPPGVNRAATVKLSFEVAPDGSVTFTAPVTKGVPELEKVSMAALRAWRFNALDPSQPQVKQRGEITFIFRLK